MTNSPLLQKMLRDAHESVMREIAADRDTPIPAEDQSMDEIATWKRSNAGPYLYVCGVEVASFLGTMYDERCEQLCAEINRAYAERTNGGSNHG